MYTIEMCSALSIDLRRIKTFDKENPKKESKIRYVDYVS